MAFPTTEQELKEFIESQLLAGPVVIEKLEVNGTITCDGGLIETSGDGKIQVEKCIRLATPQPNAEVPPGAVFISDESGLPSVKNSSSNVFTIDTTPV